ncbi:MAG: class B sortase [Lachnospiraceae bacterium]|nr:class B sortase [Lachnospiraceae bacterium]
MAQDTTTSIEPERATAEDKAVEAESDTEDKKSLKDVLGDDKPQLPEDLEIPEKDIDWDALHEENPDIYAWIVVSDTLVDYPVLQHPTDDYYYLNHNIDGSKGYPGCIYTEGTYNSKDFEDTNTVLYGHNMKDKTIFGTLHSFDDPDFAMSDKYIFIYTEDRTLVYKVFGAYEYSSKHILWSYDFSNEYIYDEYLKEIFSLRKLPGRVLNIRSDVEVTNKDKIITLSTCTTDSSDDFRYLVQGVLIGTK